MDSKTGVFITEGNLFELEDYEDLLRKKPGTTANAALGNNSVAVKTAAAPGQTSESVKKIVSLNASQTAVSSSISANGQIAKAAFQVRHFRYPVLSTISTKPVHLRVDGSSATRLAPYWWFTGLAM